jgi:CO dehydrogenase maturation factor
MKIAITGKGGVGKSTIAGILTHLAHRDGKTVLAVDSDPDANLASALGIPEDESRKIIPITMRTELIEERTGAKLKQFGQIFKLNPDVSDVAERLSYDFKGIHLIVLGAIEAGGSGCACPENIFLRNLLSHIILKRNDFVIVDMEAGIEHLGRGTARGVDLMMIIVEPTSQSVGTARTITHLAEEIGVTQVGFVGNKIASPADQEYLYKQIGAEQFLGFIPHSSQVAQAHREGISLFEHLDDSLLGAFESVYSKVLSWQK